MFSFLDTGLFDTSIDTSTSEKQRSQAPVPAANPRQGGSGFIPKPTEYAPNLNTYGAASNTQIAPPTQVVPPTEVAPPPEPRQPLQCEDARSASAIEAVMKAQLLAERKMQTMEHKIVTMLTQLSEQAANDKDKKTHGLSISSSIICIVSVIALFFLIVYVTRRSTPFPASFQPNFVAPANIRTAPMMHPNNNAFVIPTSAISQNGAPATFLPA